MSLLTDVQGLLAQGGVSSVSPDRVVIPLDTPAFNTWQGEYLSRLGDSVYKYSPAAARVLWSPTTAALLTGVAILAIMATIQRKL